MGSGPGLARAAAVLGGQVPRSGRRKGGMVGPLTETDAPSASGKADTLEVSACRTWGSCVSVRRVVVGAAAAALMGLWALRTRLAAVFVRVTNTIVRTEDRGD